MGDPGGQLAHGLHFLRLAQLSGQLLLRGDFLFQLFVGRLQFKGALGKLVFKLFDAQTKLKMRVIHGKSFGRKSVGCKYGQGAAFASVRLFENEAESGCH